MALKQYNPPHPGAFIKGAFMEELNIGNNELAEKLGVSGATISRVINGKVDLTPIMAKRLSLVLGPSPRFWLNMQNTYSLYHLEKGNDFSSLSKFSAVTAAAV